MLETYVTIDKDNIVTYAGISFEDATSHLDNNHIQVWKQGKQIAYVFYTGNVYVRRAYP